MSGRIIKLIIAKIFENFSNWIALKLENIKNITIQKVLHGITIPICYIMYNTIEGVQLGK